jgi:polyhydroxybutyrate depolymerase
MMITQLITCILKRIYKLRFGIIKAEKIQFLLLFLIANAGVSAEAYENKSININGIERNYVLKYPDAYDHNSKLPLVIALHGGGSNWQKFNKGTTKLTLQKAADHQQVLLIFPAGKDQHWNDGRKGGHKKNQAGKRKYDDIAFISRLIDLAIADYQVDADKVFITGMSNGGFMAIRLAMELPAKVSAVAAVAAQMSANIEHINLTQPLSFMLINGTGDPIVPFDGGEMKPFKFSKSKGLLLSSAATVNYFVKHNHCQRPAKKQTQDNRRFDKTSLLIKSYTECADNSRVEFITVRGGGHTWPGGKQYLPVGIIGRLSREIDASAEIMAFFLRK